MIRIPSSFQDYYCSIASAKNTSFQGPNAVSRIFSYIFQGGWRRLDSLTPGRVHEAPAAAKAAV